MSQAILLRTVRLKHRPGCREGRRDEAGAVFTNTLHLHSTFHLRGSQPYTHKNHYPNFTGVRSGALKQLSILPKVILSQ